jgi:cardiolipin synthase
MRHLPNAITTLRLLLIPWLVMLLLQSDYETAFAVFAVSAASDLLDGVIARRWNARTRFGAIADPLADKLTMLAVAVVLATQGLVPIWLAFAIVLRDLIIVGGALAFHLLIGRVEPAPSWISKLNTVLEFIALAAVLAAAAGVVDVSSWLAPLFVAVLLTIIASGTHYVSVWGRRALQLRRSARAARHTP